MVKPILVEKLWRVSLGGGGGGDEVVSNRKGIWGNLSMVSSENIHFLLMYYGEQLSLECIKELNAVSRMA